MKSISIALTLAVSLIVLPTARARLGDSEDALSQRYGKPRSIEETTGDVPTQKGYYAELKENFSTNVSLIISADTNYNEVSYGLDLVELRTRYDFKKDGLRRVVYLGNPGETYDGVDFVGKSAREVIYSSFVWATNKPGDNVSYPVAFSPATISSILEDNKGDSTWTDDWHPISIAGTYIRRTANKARMAVAYGPSLNQIYRLEVRMVDDDDRKAD